MAREVIMEHTQGWSREPEWVVLTRTFQFGDFAKAMEFAVRVGAAADDADHHPEITVSWGVARGTGVSRRKRCYVA